ncbi:MAG TPA: hypothetical protein VK358_17840 [Longimicrobium sp.]|nr:hypothetical protein [Longimicrobium sp.]
MKIRLNLEALAVESFETAGPDALRGTVHGNACSDTTCYQVRCDVTYGGPGNGTCDYSCGGDPCQATDVNCSDGTGGTGGTGGLETYNQTCATGNQVRCSCH